LSLPAGSLHLTAGSVPENKKNVVGIFYGYGIQLRCFVWRRFFSYCIPGRNVLARLLLSK